MDNHKGWTTKDEIEYLRSIGENRKASREGVETLWGKITSALAKREYKKRCLMAYLRAIKKRVRWGGMDFVLIADFAEKELNRLG